jgi:hypothetical protein
VWEWKHEGKEAVKNQHKEKKSIEPEKMIMKQTGTNPGVFAHSPPAQSVPLLFNDAFSIEI